MKATKKIVGATAALVAAVALSAGSTFAWFATNNTVDVTGMNVSVTSGNSLWVSETNSTSGFVTSLSLDDASLSGAVPCSSDGVASWSSSYSAPDFYKLKTAGNDITNTSGNVDLNSASVFEVANANSDYIAKNLWIQAEGLEGASTKDIQVSVAINGASSDIHNSLRILFITESTSAVGNTVWFAPTGAAYGENKGPIVAIDTDGTPSSLATAPTLNQTGTKIESATGVELIDSITESTPVALHMYIWFEGQDTACTASNVDATQLSISVRFSLVDHT